MDVSRAALRSTGTSWTWETPSAGQAHERSVSPSAPHRSFAPGPARGREEVSGGWRPGVQNGEFSSPPLAHAGASFTPSSAQDVQHASSVLAASSAHPASQLPHTPGQESREAIHPAAAEEIRQELSDTRVLVCRACDRLQEQLAKVVDSATGLAGSQAEASAALAEAVQVGTLLQDTLAKVSKSPLAAALRTDRTWAALVERCAVLTTALARLTEGGERGVQGGGVPPPTFNSSSAAMRWDPAAVGDRGLRPLPAERQAASALQSLHSAVAAIQPTQSSAPSPAPAAAVAQHPPHAEVQLPPPKVSGQTPVEAVSAALSQHLMTAPADSASAAQARALLGSILNWLQQGGQGPPPGVAAAPQPAPEPVVRRPGTSPQRPGLRAASPPQRGSGRASGQQASPYALGKQERRRAARQRGADASLGKARQPATPGRRPSSRRRAAQSSRARSAPRNRHGQHAQVLSRSGRSVPSHFLRGGGGERWGAPARAQASSQPPTRSRSAPRGGSSRQGGFGGTIERFGGQPGRDRAQARRGQSPSPARQRVGSQRQARGRPGAATSRGRADRALVYDDKGSSAPRSQSRGEATRRARQPRAGAFEAQASHTLDPARGGGLAHLRGLAGTAPPAHRGTPRRSPPTTPTPAPPALGAGQSQGRPVPPREPVVEEVEEESLSLQGTDLQGVGNMTLAELLAAPHGASVLSAALNTLAARGGGGATPRTPHEGGTQPQGGPRGQAHDAADMPRSRSLLEPTDSDRPSPAATPVHAAQSAPRSEVRPPPSVRQQEGKPPHPKRTPPSPAMSPARAAVPSVSSSVGAAPPVEAAPSPSTSPSNGPQGVPPPKGPQLNPSIVRAGGAPYTVPGDGSAPATRREARTAEEAIAAATAFVNGAVGTDARARAIAAHSQATQAPARGMGLQSSSSQPEPPAPQSAGPPPAPAQPAQRRPQGMPQATVERHSPPPSHPPPEAVGAPGGSYYAPPPDAGLAPSPFPRTHATVARGLSVPPERAHPLSTGIRGSASPEQASGASRSQDPGASDPMRLLPAASGRDAQAEYYAARAPSPKPTAPVATTPKRPEGSLHGSGGGSHFSGVLHRLMSPLPAPQSSAGVRTGQRTPPQPLSIPPQRNYDDRASSRHEDEALYSHPDGSPRHSPTKQHLSSGQLDEAASAQLGDLNSAIGRIDQLLAKYE